MGFDVFISYSSRDREAVAAIAAYLERDLLVWWDRELVSGTDYEQDIFAKLARTGAVLVVWSANAAASPWVEKEAREALAGKRLVIPVLLDMTPLPDYLQSIDGIVLRGWDRRSEDRELLQLARDIRLHKAAAEKPTGKAVAAGLAHTRADTPLATVLGFVLAMFVLLGFDTNLQTLTWAAAMIVVPLAISFAAGKAKVALPVLASTFGTGLVTGAMVVGTLSFIGLAIRSGVENQLRSVGYRPDPAVVAKEEMARAARKEVADAIRAAREAHRAEFAKTVDLGEDYAEGASLCADQRRRQGISNPAIENQQVFEDLIGSLMATDWQAEVAQWARKLYGAGCLEGDWQRLRGTSGGTANANATAADDGIAGGHARVEVPFIVGADRWSAELREALEKSDFDAARRELMTKAAAQDALALHQLGILDVLGLGAGADPNRGYLLFEKAAGAGHLAAEANLALCQIFGIGTYLDPSAGAERLRNVIARGLSLEASFWLLKTGTNLVRDYAFSELMQRLNHERAPVADLVLGVLASRGLSRPPCIMPCTEEVRSRIEALTSRGERSLARFLEAVLAAAHGPAAVRAAADGLPGVVGSARPARIKPSDPASRPEPPRPLKTRPR